MLLPKMERSLRSPFLRGGGPEQLIKRFELAEARQTTIRSRIGNGSDGTRRRRRPRGSSVSELAGIGDQLSRNPSRFEDRTWDRDRQQEPSGVPQGLDLHADEHHEVGSIRISHPNLNCERSFATTRRSNSPGCPTSRRWLSCYVGDLLRPGARYKRSIDGFFGVDRRYEVICFRAPHLRTWPSRNAPPAIASRCI